MKARGRSVMFAAIVGGFLLSLLVRILKSGSLDENFWIGMIPLGVLSVVMLVFFRWNGVSRQRILAQHCATWPSYMLCMFFAVGQPVQGSPFFALAVFFVAVLWEPLLFIACYVLGYMIGAGAETVRLFGFGFGSLSGFAVLVNHASVIPHDSAWLAFVILVFGLGALGYALASFLANTAIYARFDRWLSGEELPMNQEKTPL